MKNQRNAILCCSWLILILAVTVWSASGAITNFMSREGPISVAAWRLQLTSIILLPGFLYNLYRLSREERKKFVASWGVLSISSIGLALYFALWIWSLTRTSLPHSLLFASTSPMVIVVFSCLSCKPVSKGETIGVSVGFLGILAMAGQAEDGVTVVGDLAAFLAAISFVIYMNAGSNLRTWMPLYLYSFPVTAGAAFLLSVACQFMENYPGSGYTTAGPFAWPQEGLWLPTLLLAIGPGFVGHTGLHFVVKHISPLVISMAVTFEPLLGSVIGWGLNVSAAPSISTWTGGALLIVGTLVVNYASWRKKLECQDEVRKPLLDDPDIASLA